jgi:hypothetical protein
MNKPKSVGASLPVVVEAAPGNPPGLVTATRSLHNPTEVLRNSESSFLKLPATVQNPVQSLREYWYVEGLPYSRNTRNAAGFNRDDAYQVLVPCTVRWIPQVRAC